MRNILICGDSYSTFYGYIPERNAPYYCADGGDTDVRDVKETWWRRVAEARDANIVLNDSWSGSTIGYTGYEGDDYTHCSFMTRWEEFVEQGFFVKNDIDTVLVFGGTNDSWSDAPLGEMQYENWTKDDCYRVLPAICRYFKMIRDTLPDADVLCLINCEIKDEVADALEAAAARNSCRSIRLHDVDKQCGHPSVQGMAQIAEQVLAVLPN
jgi:hypothetical protein